MIIQKAAVRAVLLITKRYLSSLRPTVILDEEVARDLENEAFKARKHPGIIKPSTISLPPEFINAVDVITQDHNQKALREDGANLTRYLKGRHLPAEGSELKEKHKAAHQLVTNWDKNKDRVITTEDEMHRQQQRVSDQVKKVMSYNVYHWKPINYDVYNSMVYLFGRAAPEYAILVKIFAEIATRDPEFSPRSLFDFGSGVGTVTWAAREYWKKSIFEYYNVDSSPDMNDLAQLLFCDGQPTKPSQLKGAHYRQFLPAQNIGFDLVVTAYSLLELPSRQMRLQTLLNLWNKTTNYLVIVENGTQAGFSAINEARDFILKVSSKTAETHKDGEAHVFAPCPHDLLCPKFLTDDEPCKFKAGYIPIGEKAKRAFDSYSYVVFKKGKRDSSKLAWPRLVEDALVRHRHVICRLCTSEGKLDEVIVTKSRHGKMAHHCARNTESGDRLPVRLEEVKTEDT